MKVADVSVSVRCRQSLSLQELDPAYQSFLFAKRNSPHSADIDVILELKGMPETKGLTKIFDSGQSWSMLRRGSEYFAVLSPADLHKQPVWIARFNRDISKVTVYCSDVLIHEGADGSILSNPVRYPLDQILLMYFLAGKKGALIHAAAAKINGRGYAFLGRSGAGKSTLSRQFSDRKNVQFLSDDRIVIRKTDHAYKVFGTPWPGEADIAENKNSPLACLFFLSHGSENRLRGLSRKEAFERLLPVTSIPWYDRKIVDSLLIFCEDLISLVPAYELSFKPSAEVADFLDHSFGRK